VNTGIQPLRGFVKAPMHLLQRRELNDSDKILYLWLAYHCRDKGYCRVGVETLASEAGCTARGIQVKLKRLIEAGLVRRIVETGRTSKFEIGSELGQPIPPKDCSPPNEISPSPEKSCGGVVKNHSPISRCSEVDVSQIDVYTAQKGSPRRSSKKSVPKNRQVLRELLSSIDLSKFHSEYEPRGVDVSEVWERFQRTTLDGTPQKPEPNPYGYADLNLALRQWLDKETKQVAHTINDLPYPYDPIRKETLR
jgi:hypothetical protein